jgi:hypothetical protein
MVVLGEACVLALMLVWFVHAVRRERHLDMAWIALLVGLALMLTRRSFTLGAVVAAVSFGVLSLPMVRAELQRIARASARPASRDRRGGGV